MLTTAQQRYEIMKEINSFLYTKPHQNMRAEMLKIMEEFSTRTGNTAFIHRGKVYGKRLPGKPAAILDAEDLKQRLDDLLKTESTLAAEKSYVHSYLSAILNINAYAGTYAYLLPSVCHGIIRRCVPNFDGEAQEVPQEEVEKALKFNKKGESMFKQRVLKNAIME